MALSTNVRYVLFLFWLVSVFSACLLLFTNGFLLRRNVLENRTQVESNSAVFSKAIIVVVDALKYEFAVYNDSLEGPSHYLNKLPAIRDIQNSGNGMLFEFLADPPTTTMQRLKGLTTGGLPTFIDMSANFGSTEIDEDNVIDQMLAKKRIVFAGDDTWMGLFQKEKFSEAYPFPSFDVWDLDTVDNGVNSHLFEALSRPSDWDVFIGHFLGVDHAGHKFGPSHPEMARKLGEVNEAITKLAVNLPNDCVVLLLGDHGMTSTGDHGGASKDELSAALFVFSKNHKFSSKLSVTPVEQIDLAPTLSLLLGVPIPFSNLGKLVPQLFLERDPKLDSVVISRMISDNVDQVMRYLEAYQTQSGGQQLPAAEMSALRDAYERFEEMKRLDVQKKLKFGTRLLEKARDMCRKVWVDFDLDLMTAGFTLFSLHQCLLFLMVLSPRRNMCRLLVTDKFLNELVLFGLIGLAFSVVAVSKGYAPRDKTVEVACVCWSLASVTAFALSLLARFNCNGLIKNVFNFSARDSFCVVIVTLLWFSLFANSYVVEEAAVANFCTVSFGILMLLELRRKSPSGAVSKVVKNKKGPGIGHLKFILAMLLFMGLVRLSNVFFRCREEQSSYCTFTDFHKPLATLPKEDEKYQAYKNVRFAITVISMVATVLIPYGWLRRAGNMNGLLGRPAVAAAGYAPAIAAACAVAYWALQAHPYGAARLTPDQQNLLAKVAMAASIVLTIICGPVAPNMLYSEEKRLRAPQHAVGRGRRERGSVGATSAMAMATAAMPGGVQGYFHYLRSNWRRQLAPNAPPTPASVPLVVYGLGSAFSAPLLSCVTGLSLLSALLLGDGLAPVAAPLLGILVPGLFLYSDSCARLRSVEDPLELLNVPWKTVLGWYLLECIFFYASGHQPVISTIPWNAAFVGFSGANYGADLLNFLLPAVLIGWNIFCARILHGLALPALLLAPFTFWLLAPSVRQHLRQPTEDGRSQHLSADDLDTGELVLLERSENTKDKLLALCARYLVLQAARLLMSMLSAAVLRRHLMVWKIFAPRFIFEGIGFLVSAGAVLAGYCLALRFLAVLTDFYKKLEKEKS